MLIEDMLKLKQCSRCRNKDFEVDYDDILKRPVTICKRCKEVYFEKRLKTKSIPDYYVCPDCGPEDPDMAYVKEICREKDEPRICRHCLRPYPVLD